MCKDNPDLPGEDKLRKAAQVIKAGYLTFSQLKWQRLKSLLLNFEVTADPIPNRVHPSTLPA
jgi:hypothetical protein